MHFPEKIETERLVIRVAKPGDGQVLNQAVLDSLTELTPWVNWVTPPPSIEESEAVCRKAYGQFLLHKELMVLFFLKSSGELIGASGFHNPDWRRGQFEVGYWGRTQFGGAGLMTEGVRALACYALTEMKAARVFLSADALNVKSCQLAERVGFEYEGTLRQDRFGVDGKLRDTKIYSLIALPK